MAVLGSHNGDPLLIFRPDWKITMIDRRKFIAGVGVTVGFLANPIASFGRSWRIRHARRRSCGCVPQPKPLRIGYFAGDPAASDFGAAQAIYKDMLPTLTNAMKGLPNVHVYGTKKINSEFFSSIDFFVFANNTRESVLNLGQESRAALKAFIESGGTAYLGIDIPPGSDGQDILGLFGLSSNYRDNDSQEGLGEIPGNCKQTFRMSDYGVFGMVPGPLKSNACEPLGTIQVAFQPKARGYAFVKYGSAKGGQAYIFSDECPLFAGTDHAELLREAVKSAMK
jgi:hypothetical protein